MEVADAAFYGRVHVHRRDDDAVLQGEVTEPERHEHRRPRRRRCGRVEPALDVAGEPVVDVLYEAFVPQTQDRGKFIISGTADEMRTSTDPLVRQFVHGLTEGPLTDRRRAGGYEVDLLGSDT